MILNWWKFFWKFCLNFAKLQVFCISIGGIQLIKALLKLIYYPLPFITGFQLCLNNFQLCLKVDLHSLDYELPNFHQFE